jgi:hypothetical protein
MADPTAIAERALQLANDFLEGESRTIAGMAQGDMPVLLDAARIVRQQAETQAKAALGVEHLAFNLITAAYDALREEANPEP